MSLNLRAEDKGILPDRMIHALLETGAIIPEIEPDEDQVQPASIDLRLGEVAYRVRASFLPGRNGTVLERIEQLDGYAIDISAGAVLEKGCVYVVPLMEQLGGLRISSLSLTAEDVQAVALGVS